MPVPAHGPWDHRVAAESAGNEKTGRTADPGSAWISLRADQRGERSVGGCRAAGADSCGPLRVSRIRLTADDAVALPVGWGSQAISGCDIWRGRQAWTAGQGRGCVLRAAVHEEHIVEDREPGDERHAVGDEIRPVHDGHALPVAEVHGYGPDARVVTSYAKDDPRADRD